MRQRLFLDGRAELYQIWMVQEASMATIAVPLVFALIGALVYLLSHDAKRARLGEITFFVGMFWLAYQLSGRALHF